MKTRFFFSAVALKGAFAILCAVPVFSWAQECIQITAQITQTNLVKLGGPDHWTFPVTCSVWSNRWKIVSRFPGNALNSAYYDGTNVYSRLEPVSEGDAKTNAEPDHATIWIAPSPGGHPLGNLGLNIPWLAFCSGSYLKLPNRIIPLPVVDVPGTADSLSYVDKTTIFEEEGGLPKMVELFTSKAAYLNSLSDERLYRNSTLLHAQLTKAFSLADGLVRFRYVVEAFTNFNGRIFPMEFRYFDYRVFNNNSNLTLVAEGIGTVTSIGQAGEPKNVLSTNAVQTVLDCRFRQHDKLIDTIYYDWAKAEVPPTNDPVLQQRLKDTVRGAATVKSPARAQWIRLGLWAGCVIPLVLLLFAFRRRKSNNESANS